ncbi:hypothetical protein [Actinoplanes sp. NPDC026619]|uniref:hypothetical protein n=1 Tax=Actinoplanes sp. NPDC026619 TaxID=3155798 RepID=UPI0033D49CC4
MADHPASSGRDALGSDDQDRLEGKEIGGSLQLLTEVGPAEHLRGQQIMHSGLQLVDDNGALIHVAVRAAREASLVRRPSGGRPE